MQDYANHRHTPTLLVNDPRGLTVRRVAYERNAQEAATRRVSSKNYDPPGRLVAQWDPRLFALADSGEDVSPSVEVLSYTMPGQALASVSVDAGWQVSLNSQTGQHLEHWDSRGSHSRLTYDLLMRPIALFEQTQGEPERCCGRMFYAGTASEDIFFNRCSRLVRRDDEAGIMLTPSYEISGQLSEQTRQFLAGLSAPDWPDAPLEDHCYRTSWQHDAFGAVLYQTDAAGNVQKLRYDMAGQLAKTCLTRPGQAAHVLLRNIVYDAFGEILSETTGNDVISTRCYDPANGRLTRLYARRANDTLLQDLNYHYDAVGNVRHIDDAAQPAQYFRNQRTTAVSTFNYDTLNQLISATGREIAAVTPWPAPAGQFPAKLNARLRVNYRETYRYDASGNLQELVHTGDRLWTQRIKTSRCSNRSLPYVNDKPPGEDEIAEAFDLNGNSRALHPGQALVWDLRNQLMMVTPITRSGRADDSEHYIYDASGQRIRKVSLRQASKVEHKTDVRYLPGLEIHRDNVAGGKVLHVITVNAGCGGMRMMHWEHGKPRAIASDQLRYNLTDRLGSINLELDDQAAIVTQEGFYPFGGTAWWASRDVTEVDYKTIRYSGKERDATGLYYYGKRYYASWLMRWINPDPEGVADGLNSFCFTGNNPVTLVDSQGLMKTQPDASAAQSILRFFKSLPKREASFHKMLKAGRYWRESGIQTTADLSQNMQTNEKRSRAFIATMDDREQAFFDAFRSTRLFAVHRSNNEFPAGFRLTSYASSDRVGEGMTSSDDVSEVATTDFVFFTIQASLEETARVSKSSNDGAPHEYGFDISLHPKLRTGIISLFDPLGIQPDALHALRGGPLDILKTQATRRIRNRVYNDDATTEVKNNLYDLSAELPLQDILGSEILRLTRGFDESDRDTILATRDTESYTRLINSVLAPELMVPHHFLPNRNSPADLVRHRH